MYERLSVLVQYKNGVAFIILLAVADGSFLGVDASLG
jgi:hypothetical protein